MLRIYSNMCHCIHKGGSCKHFDKGGTFKSQTISPLKIKCKSIKQDTEEVGGTNGCFYCCNVCTAKRIYTKKGATYKGWPKRFGNRNKVVDGKVSQCWKEKQPNQSNQSKNIDKKITFKASETSSDDTKQERSKQFGASKKVAKSDFWKTHHHVYRYIEKHKCLHCQKHTQSF